MITDYRHYLLIVLLAALSGCAVAAREQEAVVAPAAVAAYVADKPAALQPHYETLLRQGSRNEVLNHLRIGLGAMDLGATPAATDSFDRALQGIEAVYANNETAAKAREKFTRESYKDFKGEPYERAMAYYYRGVLYLFEGDYENARASFRGGMLQDAFAEEEQNRSDFALLAFLEGWASRCRGDAALASVAFEEMARLKGGVPVPPADHNVLLLAELGNAPVKYGDGSYSSQLKYRPAPPASEVKAVWELGARRVEAVEVEDIFYQASTRGGRPVDFILEGKVQFKESADTTGKVLTTVGVATMAAGLASGTQAGGYIGLAGGAIALAGLAARGIAAATTPQADTRYWDNLPGTIQVATQTGGPSESAYGVQFLDGSGDPVGGSARNGEIHFAGNCGVAWARSQSAVPVSARAPGSVTKE